MSSNVKPAYCGKVALLEQHSAGAAVWVVTLHAAGSVVVLKFHSTHLPFGTFVLSEQAATADVPDVLQKLAAKSTQLTTSVFEPAIAE